MKVHYKESITQQIATAIGAAKVFGKSIDFIHLDRDEGDQFTGELLTEHRYSNPIPPHRDGEQYVTAYMHVTIRWQA